ncbi:unnamed protein product [Rotaria sp. Silwood2]|nr:unnamed protein product [Rotaria sp. Silwood2]
MTNTTKSSDKENINVTFIKSNKNQLLLVLNDYLYKCNKKTAKKKYWMCTSKGCKMYVHTDSNDVYLCGGTDPHDHESNPEMIAVKDVRHKIKDRALNEVTPISMIYEQELSKTSISSTTMAIIPTCHEIGPSVAKARRKIVPLLPHAGLFDIPDDYKATIDRKRFFRHFTISNWGS